MSNARVLTCRVAESRGRARDVANGVKINVIVGVAPVAVTVLGVFFCDGSGEGADG